MGVERVLIATDLSESSLAIARSAVELARVHDARAVVFHAVSPLADLVLPADTRSDWLGRTVAGARARLGSIEGAEVEVAVGPADDAILEQARSMDADLVILGARAPDDPWRLLVGSVSLQVARSATCPVLIAREPLKSGRFERALVAVDLSDLSRPALEAAASLVEPGASIELIHVVELDGEVPEDFAEIAARERVEILEKLDRFVREIDLATLPIEAHAELGRVADQILEAVGVARCDLIAIGARRRENHQAALGTIADRVLRCATVPVLVVPP